MDDNDDDDAQEEEQEYGEEGELRLVAIDDGDGGLAGAGDGAHKREGPIKLEPRVCFPC